jgi:hypothetical protein
MRLPLTRLLIFLSTLIIPYHRLNAQPRNNDVRRSLTYRYQQNFKHLLELAPGLKHLIGSSDCKKTAELNKIIGKVSICAYMRAFMLSDTDPRWSLLYQEHALTIRRV